MDDGKEAGEAGFQWESTQETVVWGLKWRNFLMWSPQGGLESLEKI